MVIICQEFCYCSGINGKICEYGYENIMENDQLKYAFMEECCYNMNTNSYNTLRLFTTDFGPHCNDASCPKCDCDGLD